MNRKAEFPVHFEKSDTIIRVPTEKKRANPDIMPRSKLISLTASDSFASQQKAAAIREQLQQRQPEVQPAPTPATDTSNEDTQNDSTWNRVATAWNSFADKWNGVVTPRRVLKALGLTWIIAGGGGTVEGQQGLPVPHKDTASSMTTIPMASPDAKGAVRTQTKQDRWTIDDVRMVPKKDLKDALTSGTIDFEITGNHKTEETTLSVTVPENYAVDFVPAGLQNPADLIVAERAVHGTTNAASPDTVFGTFATDRAVAKVTADIPPDAPTKLKRVKADGFASPEAGPNRPHSVDQGNVDPENISLAEGRAQEVVRDTLAKQGIQITPETLVSITGTESQFSDQEWKDLLKEAKRLGIGNGKSDSVKILRFADAGNKGKLKGHAKQVYESHIDSKRKVAYTQTTETESNEHRTISLPLFPLLFLARLPKFKRRTEKPTPGDPPPQPPEPPPNPPPEPPPPEPPPQPPPDPPIIDIFPPDPRKIDLSYTPPKARNTGKNIVKRGMQVGIGTSGAYGSHSMPRGQNNHSAAEKPRGKNVKAKHSGKR